MLTTYLQEEHRGKITYLMTSSESELVKRGLVFYNYRGIMVIKIKKTLNSKIKRLKR